MQYSGPSFSHFFIKTTYFSPTTLFPSNSSQKGVHFTASVPPPNLSPFHYFLLLYFPSLHFLKTPQFLNFYSIISSLHLPSILLPIWVQYTHRPPSPLLTFLFFSLFSPFFHLFFSIFLRFFILPISSYRPFSSSLCFTTLFFHHLLSNLSKFFTFFFKNLPPSKIFSPPLVFSTPFLPQNHPKKGRILQPLFFIFYTTQIFSPPFLHFFLHLFSSFLFSIS